MQAARLQARVHHACNVRLSRTPASVELPLIASASFCICCEFSFPETARNFDTGTTVFPVSTSVRCVNVCPPGVDMVIQKQTSVDCVSDH